MSTLLSDLSSLDALPRVDALPSFDALTRELYGREVLTFTDRRMSYGQWVCEQFKNSPRPARQELLREIREKLQTLGEIPADTRISCSDRACFNRGRRILLEGLDSSEEHGVLRLTESISTIRNCRQVELANKIVEALEMPLACLAFFDRICWAEDARNN